MIGKRLLIPSLLLIAVSRLVLASAFENPKIPSEAHEKPPSFALKFKEWQRNSISKIIAKTDSFIKWVDKLELDRSQWLAAEKQAIAEYQEDPLLFQFLTQRLEEENVQRASSQLEFGQEITRAYESSLDELDRARNVSLRFAQYTYADERYDGSPISISDRGDIEWPWRRLSESLGQTLKDNLARGQKYIEAKLFAPPVESVQQDDLDFYEKEPVFHYDIFLDKQRADPYFLKELRTALDDLWQKKINNSLKGDSGGNLYYDGRLVWVYFRREFRENEPRTQTPPPPAYTGPYTPVQAIQPVALPRPPLDEKGQETMLKRMRERSAYVYYRKPRYDQLQKDFLAFKRSPPPAHSTVKPISFATKDRSAISPYPAQLISDRALSLWDFDGIDSREVTFEGVEVHDLEGPMANRRVDLTIRPGPTAAFPMAVCVSSFDPQVYFDVPSEPSDDAPRKCKVRVTDAEGHEEDKTMTLTNIHSYLKFSVSVRPDSNNKNETIDLMLNYTSPKTAGLTKTEIVPLRIIDEDKPEIRPYINVPLPNQESAYRFSNDREPFSDDSPFRSETLPSPKQKSEFPVTVDFTRDLGNWFYDRVGKTLIQPQAGQFLQAVQDIVYYLKAKNPRTIAPHQEMTLFTAIGILPGQTVIPETTARENQIPFEGLLIYPTAANNIKRNAVTVVPHADNEPVNEYSYQKIHSAQIHFEGIHSTPGYSFETDPKKWWLDDTANLNKPLTLVSVVAHEILHALGLNGFNPKVVRWLERKVVIDLALELYNNGFPKLAHFYSNVDPANASSQQVHFPFDIDPDSGHGALGANRGEMPIGQRLVNQFNLLLLKAAGLELREISAFKALSWLKESTTLPPARVGETFLHKFDGTGGAPAYDWKFEGGFLPSGMHLNRFSGELSGAPDFSGVYYFMVSLNDQNSNRIPTLFRMVVEPAKVSAPPPAPRLITAPLPPAPPSPAQPARNPIPKTEPLEIKDLPPLPESGLVPKK